MTHIFPAIDLMGGECVRLLRGDFDAKTSYADDPVAMAKQFEAEGAQWLHVVDLDGAKDGERAHAAVISDIAEQTSLKVQSGGGIRTREDVQGLLGAGVERVVVGSLCVTAPDTVREWMQEFGPERIVVALDVRVENEVPRPAVRGWTETTDESLWDVMKWYPDMSTVLITDISRDGMMEGGNLGLYRDVQTWFPDVDLITSGGVGTLDDVKRLKLLEPHGIIIGKAIYEGRFTVAEAMAC